ncbi:MAG: hypothetical protein ABJA67_18395 [Chthonomonadales bacterium]
MSRKIIALVAILLLGVSMPLKAQQDVVPKEVTALLNDIAEIDNLRTIAPLKISAEQKTKITELLSTLLESYNKRTAKGIVPAIQELAQEIKRVRASVLAGKAIPAGFDEKVRQMEADFIEKREKENNLLLRGFTDGVKPLLTKDQIATGTKLARSIATRNGSDLKGGDELAMGYLLLFGYATQVKTQQNVVPKEVTALVTDISDIDKMRVLSPIKITSDQYASIAKLISDSFKVYNQKVTEALVPPIQAYAKEIRQVKADVIAGKPVPDGFDKKVKEIEDSFFDKRATEDSSTLKSVSDELRKIFTQAQVDAAIELAKTLPAKTGKKLKGTDDQFFNFYVKGTFLEYPGIITLLNNLKNQPAP